MKTKEFIKLKSPFKKGKYYKRSNLFLNFILIASLIIGVSSFTSCNTDTKSASEKNTNESMENNDYITQTAESQASMTPEEAVNMLKEGNSRFVNKSMIDRNFIEQVEETSDGQYPFAAVVSCIDSRIPTEIVFDQGVGDIFNARIAGNFVNDDILGSLEFACKVAGSKTIVVLGHTHCGAVKGAADDVKLGKLTTTLEKLAPAINAVTDVEGERNSKNEEYVQKVSDKNVELTIEKIKSDSEVLREMFENGEISIVGAMYDVETGKVSFME